MGFISTDTAQSKKYAIGRIHNGLKVLFCSRHATPLIIIIMQNCRNWTMTKDLEESVNACWYILSRVCLSCCQFPWLHSCIYGVVSVQQFHSVLVGHGDISVLHLIKSEVSAYPIVIYFCGCVSGMLYHHILSVAPYRSCESLIVHWNHNLMVICPTWLHGHAHGHNKHTWNLEDAKTPWPLGRWTPTQVHWNYLGL